MKLHKSSGTDRIPPFTESQKLLHRNGSGENKLLTNGSNLDTIRVSENANTDDADGELSGGRLVPLDNGRKAFFDFQTMDSVVTV